MISLTGGTGFQSQTPWVEFYIYPVLLYNLGKDDSSFLASVSSSVKLEYNIYFLMFL